MSEENIKDIIPKNLESVFDLLKIYLSLLCELKTEMADEFPSAEIDKFFAAVVRPNL